MGLLNQYLNQIASPSVFSNHYNCDLRSQMDKQVDSQAHTLRAIGASLVRETVNGQNIRRYQEEKDEEQNTIQEITSQKYPFKTKNILKYGALIVILGLMVGIFGSSTTTEPKPVKAPLSYFTQKAFNQMSKHKPSQYIDVQKVKPYSQLPFCIIIRPELEGQQKEKIKGSIRVQEYSNYVIVDESQILKSGSLSYAELLLKVRQSCSEYSILLFVNGPLDKNSLNVTNHYYQTLNMWMAYSVKGFPSEDPTIEVSSIYFRILELVESNDFYMELNKIKSSNFGSENFNQLFITVLFELCRFNAKNVSLESLYSTQDSYRAKEESFLSIKLKTKKADDELSVSRIPFQVLLTLDQDYRIDVEAMLAKRQQFYKSNVTLITLDLFGRLDHQATHRQFQQIMEFQQMIYLSPNHSLCALDKRRMIEKYQIQKYSQYKDQLSMCVCIFSHNNEQNNRARKIIKSIVRQDYENFHIVFIDDLSSDRTLQQTMDQLKRLKFPKEKTTIVHNLRHKFATYNYVNSAFTYCHEDDIQVIMDGDDQLIGQNVLQFVNRQYQEDKSLWLMHTFYKSNQYTQGFNLLPFTNDFVLNVFGGRRFMYFISPLRTWAVKLIRSLPLREHISPLTGQWYDTACDVALQYGLFEMAGGEKHSKYFPEINYLYFNGYGDNDDSTVYKNSRRNLIHFLMTLRSPLKPLKDLEQNSQNQQIKAILKKDSNSDYKVVEL